MNSRTPVREVPTRPSPVWGRGIPLGQFDPQESEFGRPYTGAVTATRRSSLPALLRSAQSTKIRLVLNLAGGQRRYVDPDGTFNLELWKREIDQYRDVDFAPYVTEGLVLAHYLVDEPLSPDTWGGRAISMEEIEEMAHYSKSIWPSLPTTVGGVRPRLLRGFDWHYLDIAWPQWAGPLQGAGAGRTPEEFRDENVAYAKELGLGLIFGLNVVNGGDGSSGIPGTRQGHWRMTGAELQHAGVTLADTPYACAFFIWRHDPEYERAQTYAPRWTRSPSPPRREAARHASAIPRRPIRPHQAIPPARAIPRRARHRHADNRGPPAHCLACSTRFSRLSRQRSAR